MINSTCRRGLRAKPLFLSALPAALLCLLTISGCSSENKRSPNDTGISGGNVLTLDSNRGLNQQNREVLLAQIQKLEAQQLENNNLIKQLRNQILKNQLAAEQAQATADAAQLMSATSDDRMEQLFQQSTFK